MPKLLIMVVVALLVGIALFWSLQHTGQPQKQTGQAQTSSVHLPDPAAFVDKIDNKYFPLPVGTTFIFEGTAKGGSERVEVFVSPQTKKILGVITAVIRDRVTVDGKLVEETFDWYAQDKDSNVWYFGEDAKEYRDGVVVNTEGSWEAGVNGAQPGIIMEANPKVGDSYHQEYAKGVAEDMAQVLSLKETSSVPYGSFDNLLMTKEWSALKPGIVEHKYYASGVGQIRSTMVQGGTEQSKLVEIRHQ
jgi:hypothetical protein